MRLWTLHPALLDARGLVALWREALLAQKVLAGATSGYRHHPQLVRFQALGDPLAGIAAYLAAVHEEAVRRGYRFDATKITETRHGGLIDTTDGQLAYEFEHLRRKLAVRDHAKFQELQSVTRAAAHPLFRIVPGGVAAWETGINGSAAGTASG